MSMDVSSNILVLGGGIAGIQSALLLAEKDHQVYVMDSAPSIGGFFPLLERTFPTNSCGICFMSPRPPAYCPIYENQFHQNITVLTSCDLQEVNGKAGNFKVTYKERPRHVDGNKCNMCNKCAEICPVEVKREIWGGLENRKAIYLPFLQAIPHYYLIDEKACTRCGKCLSVCPKGAIDLGKEERIKVMNTGAIILGFGFQPNPPELKGEYGFGRYKNVLSNIQYERTLDTSGPTHGLPMRLSDRKKIKKLAFIQCVGSRDISCGQEYCSSICCSIAIKQAMISKSRISDMDVAVFYMDIRAMGKEYEEYFRKSKEKYGIRYIRSAVSSLRELKRSDNLLITYGSDNGQLFEEEFDTVILSLGFRPPDEIRKTAGILGVKLNEYGFCETEEFSPTQTSVSGIFVAGAFREPQDIPESVLDACSAAANASELLHDSDTEHHLPNVFEKDIPVRPDEELRIGIFVCDKHNLIKQQLDLIELLGELDDDKDIIRIKRIDFSIMEEGLREVKDLIGHHHLNRVIIAGYRCLEINQYIKQHSEILGTYSSLISLANIGEQCANVHLENRHAATEKAYRLIIASIETAKFSVPKKRGKKIINRRVMVIGGGISGLSCSISLAEQGFDVSLIERENELGGNARHIYYTLKGTDVQKLLKEFIKNAESNSRIDIYRNSRLSSLEGTWGSYKSVISTAEDQTEIRHGAVIFAVGGQEIDPEGFLYGENKNVITQRELERQLHFREEKLNELKSIVMIQCVNCRNDTHPYCSRICCLHAVKNALKLKEQNHGINVYILYRDIRTYGFYEKYYLKARKEGVLFIRYDEDNPPIIDALDGHLKVSFFDKLINEEINMKVDYAVLSNGMEPRNNAEIAETAGVKMIADGFFAEANPKSAPLDSIDRGKFFCGICHSPNPIENVIIQGKAAAQRASVLLWHSEGYFVPSQAFVTERLCTGCGICVSACSFGARVIDPVTNKAVVKEDICKGCGICVASCKNGASGQYDFDKMELMRELDQIMI